MELNGETMEIIGDRHPNPAGVDNIRAENIISTLLR